MGSIVDTSFLNFSLTNSISGKYTQVQKNSYLKSIQSQEDAANTRISALGKLLNFIEELKTSLEGIKIESPKIMKTKVSDERILTATASSSATEGSYSVKVHRTAKPHTLKSLWFKFDTKGIMSLDIGKMNSAMISSLSNVTTTLNSLAEKIEITVNSYIDSIIPGQQDAYRTLINECIKAEKTTYKSFNR